MQEPITPPECHLFADPLPPACGTKPLLKVFSVTTRGSMKCSRYSERQRTWMVLSLFLFPQDRPNYRPEN